MIYFMHIFRYFRSREGCA